MSVVQTFAGDTPVPGPTNWTKYSHCRPEVAGPYRWRLQSKIVAGLHVEFVAHMRMRGAGFETVLSPAFDYWNGARVLVPADAEWTATDVVSAQHEFVGVALPSVELLPCPFCRNVPTWHGMNYDGGVLIGAHPGEYNDWRLECCSWARTPHYRDPRELAATRNAKIAKGRV